MITGQNLRQPIFLSERENLKRDTLPADNIWKLIPKRQKTGSMYIARLPLDHSVFPLQSLNTIF